MREDERESGQLLLGERGAGVVDNGIVGRLESAVGGRVRKKIRVDVGEFEGVVEGDRRRRKRVRNERGRNGKW